MSSEERLHCVELCPICRGADVLRSTSSPELRGQFQSVQREALLTMRTLIDHALERLAEAETDAEAERDARVQDIPIE
ncbi:MAG TPA: hypothetical protein VK326_05075 [Solirubrobacterales bacterium]|nr:hypothetical protein [Solirubrobacterales bacterium]